MLRPVVVVAADLGAVPGFEDEKRRFEEAMDFDGSLIGQNRQRVSVHVLIVILSRFAAQGDAQIALGENGASFSQNPTSTVTH